MKMISIKLFASVSVINLDLLTVGIFLAVLRTVLGQVYEKFP